MTSPPLQTQQVINGIDLERVAALVSGKPSLMATREEHRIAEAARKYGEKLERQGYIPAVRRAAMQREMVRLAREAVPAIVLRNTAMLDDEMGRPAEQDGEE